MAICRTWHIHKYMYYVLYLSCDIVEKVNQKKKKNFNNKILTFKKIQKKGKYMREEITLHLHRIISCPLRNFNNNI